MAQVDLYRNICLSSLAVEKLEQDWASFG